MTRLNGAWSGALRGWRDTPTGQGGAVAVPSGAAVPQPEAGRALPAVLQPWRPGRAVEVPKPTAANLRRMAEEPVVRRAINLVKDRVCNMQWQVRLRASAVPDARTAERLRVLRRLMDAPNPLHSFRTFAEQVLEDIVVGGFGAVEIEHTGDPDAPLRLWPLDGAAVQVDAAWNGDPEVPRYAYAGGGGYAAGVGYAAGSGAYAAGGARAAGAGYAAGSGSVVGGGYAAGGFGSGAVQPLLDRELMYVRLNPRSHTPLGLGRVEVAFDAVNRFLSAHRYAGRLASNSVVQYALWLDEASPAEHERLIRWWQDEVEGTGQVPILSTDRKPEVLRFGSGTDEDLRLKWQEFLIRVIANAFDLPPMFLGLQEDVNRSTAEEMSTQSFESAVLPVASLFADHMTRDVLDRAMGWPEFEFVFVTEARDEATETALQLQLLEAGVLSVDEVRAIRGLPPLRPVPDMTARDVEARDVEEKKATEEDDADRSE